MHEELPVGVLLEQREYLGAVADVLVIGKDEDAYFGPHVARVEIN